MAILKYESENELYHHGIKGQKWGVRRFQNRDGSVTSAGAKRYYGRGHNESRDEYISRKTRAVNKDINSIRSHKGSLSKENYKGAMQGLESVRAKQAAKYGAKYDKRAAKAAKEKRLEDLNKEYSNLEDQMTYGRHTNHKKNLDIERRLRDIDREIDPKGMAKWDKKQAAKQYAQDQLDNEGRLGRAYDHVTGAHKRTGKMRADMNTDAQNRAISEKRSIAKSNAGEQKRLDKLAAGRKRYHKGESRPERLNPSETDSAVTKKVKKNYNQMTDQEFMNKYQVSKNRYARSVAKYGDPYMNGKLARLGKKLQAQQNKETFGKEMGNITRKLDRQSKKNNNSSRQEAKRRSDARALFKKYPQLVKDFGSPNQIDDWDFFDLVVAERGYKK